VNKVIKNAVATEAIIRVRFELNISCDTFPIKFDVNCN
jgi:hypothetical protein